MPVYTDIFVNTALDNPSPEVVEVFTSILDDNSDSREILNKYNLPSRWNSMFYTSPVKVFRSIGANMYQIIALGEVKNYDDEVEELFNYIRPYTPYEEMIGYSLMQDPTITHPLIWKGREDDED